MPSNVHFVFVPGAWHSPYYYEPLIAELAKLGYSSETVPLHVDAIPAVESFDPDVEAVVSKLSQLMDGDKDIILGLHSYAGIVGIEAVGRLSEQRSAAGKSIDRLKRMVFIASFIPFIGESGFTIPDKCPDDIKPENNPGWFSIEGPYMVLDKAKAPEVFYNDIDQETRVKLGETLGKQCMAAFGTPIGHNGLAYAPSTYIHATMDNAVSHGFQKWMVQRAQGQGRTEVNRDGPFGGDLGGFTLESGHTPMISKTEQMRDIFVKVAVA